MLRSAVKSGDEKANKMLLHSENPAQNGDGYDVALNSNSKIHDGIEDKISLSTQSKQLQDDESNATEESKVKIEDSVDNEATSLTSSSIKNQYNKGTKDLKENDVIAESPSKYRRKIFQHSSKNLLSEIEEGMTSSSPSIPPEQLLTTVSNSPSNVSANELTSQSESNGNCAETSEEISVRSRYGRTHKPKPLTEGFLTTDRKVGAFLGHSPQNSPRKKEDSLRLSLKSHKKISPNKVSHGEKLLAALESIKKNMGNGMTTSTTPKSKNVVCKQPRILTDEVMRKIYTYDLPSKTMSSRKVRSTETSIENQAEPKEDSPSKKLNHQCNVDNSESMTTVSEIKDCTGIENEDTSSSDLPAAPDEAEPVDVKKGIVDDFDDEVMAEKESDSGVESSATAPPSEPEDGVQEGSKEEDVADAEVPPPSSGEWLVGDLVWGHIKGHPFWPCIVVHEPEQGIYIKSLNVGRNKMSHFHVRFFGDNARRSWIRSNQIIKFVGSNDYLKLIEQHPNRKKDFEVTSRNIPKWKAAVEEAEELLRMGRAERLESFSDKYSDVLKEESKSEDKMDQAVDLTPKLAARKNRKRQRPVSTSPSSSENESPQREDGKVKDKVKSSRYRTKYRKIKPMTPFDVFSEKHHERVVDEFPDLNGEGIDAVLQQRWEMLDDSVKSRYENRGSSDICDGDKISDNDVAEMEENVTSKEGDVQKSETKKTEKRKNRKTMSRVDVTSKRRGLFRGLKADKVCIQCEEPGGEVVKCRGQCFRFFHGKCAPKDSKGTDGSEEFRCGSCVAGEMAPCNACWKKEEEEKKDGERKRCSQHACGRCYHEECLAEWPQAWWSRHTFTCPSHCCHTCASDDPREARMHTSQAEKLVRCIRCPATYHSGDFCLPAGCEILTGSQVICQRHYKPPKKGAYHMNTSWCFICSMGGSLICCDRCPSSFHPQCLNITAPEGSYICEDCDSARYPLYGEVVWVKLGRYRWWPAQILYPIEIPENVLSLPHALGEFAVRFFGSHDHYWVNNGRAFLYQEGDSAKTAAPKSGTDALFARALQEASVSYKEHARKKAEWEASNIAGRNSSSKPPRFVRIKTNKPVGDVKPFETVHASYTPCDCDPKTEKPCSQEPNCLNRMLMVECVPGLCRAGDHCGNQRFQKRQYPPLSTCRTEGRGWGLQTLADICQGDFVVEYVGEMINEVECHRRIERMHRLKDENYYFLTIDKDHILDAGPKGNLSRFMNHSCDPNCETQKWTVGGETRVGLFALRDIPGGTELTFNYNLQVIGTDRRPCLCGAPNCVRFIGAKAKSEQEESNSENGNSLPAKKMKVNGKTPKKPEKPAKVLGNVCHICGHGGELVYCSIKACGKGYHSSCTEVNEELKGKWLCPLHLCFTCGSTAVSHCGECDNSFCCDHVNEKVNSKRGMTCLHHIKKEKVSSTSVLVETNSERGLKDTVVGRPSEAPTKDPKDMKESNVRNSRRRSSLKIRVSLSNES